MGFGGQVLGTGRTPGMDGRWGPEGGRGCRGGNQGRGGAASCSCTQLLSARLVQQDARYAGWQCWPAWQPLAGTHIFPSHAHAPTCAAAVAPTDPFRLFDRIRDLDCGGLKVRDVGTAFLAEELEGLQVSSRRGRSKSKRGGGGGRRAGEGRGGGRWGTRGTHSTAPHASHQWQTRPRVASPPPPPGTAVGAFWFRVWTQNPPCELVCQHPAITTTIRPPP